MTKGVIALNEQFLILQRFFHNLIKMMSKSSAAANNEPLFILSLCFQPYTLIRNVSLVWQMSAEPSVAYVLYAEPRVSAGNVNNMSCSYNSHSLSLEIDRCLIIHGCSELLRDGSLGNKLLT